MPDTHELTSSSLEALSQQYRAIANNLANASTPGFKRSRTLFQQVLEKAGNAKQSPLEKVASRPAVDFSQGTLTPTGWSLDLAIQGQGMFRLETPDGPLYTRSGQFRVNNARQLVNPAGHTVGGPITLPPTVSPSDISVSRNGTLTAGGVRIGKLPVVMFQDPQKLAPAGQNCFRAPRGVEEADATDFTVHQGFFESSNVSVVEELVGLITVTRMYEANLKNIRVQDEETKSLLNVAMS
jgi:flagellar basal-body rod protein FlgF